MADPALGPAKRREPPERKERRAGWRWAFHRLREYLFLAIDRLLLSVIPHARPQAVMVIATHGLGDLVLFAPFWPKLLALYPGRPSVLVCSIAARDFALRVLAPDRIIVLDRVAMRRHLGQRIGVLRAVARAGTEIAIQPTFNRDLLIEDTVIRASRARLKIGSVGTAMFITERQRRIGDRWYTRLVPEAPEIMHDSRRYGAFLAALGAPVGGVKRLRLAAPPRGPLVPLPPYLLIACAASAPVKAWPAKRFLKVAAEIADRTRLAVVLSAGPGEAAALPQSGGAAVINLVGRVAFEDFLALIAHARLVLANDSAPAHLAAALGVAAVVVMGGGIPGRYWPYPEGDDSPVVAVSVTPAWECFGCGWRCRYALAPGEPAPCIAAVGEAEIVRQAMDCLGRRTGADAQASPAALEHDRA